MDAHEIWAAAQIIPGEAIEDGVARVEELIAEDKRDAERFRKLCTMLQLAYDDGVFESESVDVYCRMQSGWRDERQVQVELRWSGSLTGR